AEGYLIGSNPAEERAQARRFGDYRFHGRDDYPLLPFHPDGRLTMIAGLSFSGGKVTGAYAIPTQLGSDNSPRPVAADCPEGAEILNYLRRCCEEEELATEIKVDGTTIAGQRAAVFIARE